MTIIQTKEFGEVYRLHTITGGEHGQMANKAAKVITNLTHGVPPGVATTNHGESRLRNCTKYALNDSFRLVTVHQDGRCFVLYMGKHDKCDEWLVRHRNMQIVYNPTTDHVALVSGVEDATRTDLVTPPLNSEDGPLLVRVPETDWTSVISSPLQRMVCTSLKESDGDRIWESIAAVQQENPKLADLLVTVINHVRRSQLIEAKLAVDKYMGVAQAHTPETDIPSEVLNEALRDPANRERFIVLNDLTPEQMEVLWDPNRFQDWMVYLHEGQGRVVEENFPLPAVLTGVSGSGKTCVLVHRARRLALCYPQERILILTLNRSLARLLENLVAQLCSKDVTGRIDVISFYDYMSNLLGALDLQAFLETLGKCTNHSEAVSGLMRRLPPQELHKLFRALDERELFSKFNDFVNDANNQGTDEAVKLWNFLSTTEVNVDPIHYLYEEMELVRSAFPAIAGYAEYLEDYERPGRSIAFQRNRREQVLGMLHAWEAYQLREGFLDHMGLSQAANVAIDDRRGIPSLFKYRCVLVDEFQDFSTLDLGLLTKIPKELENGLFLTGDLAQKIYAKELSFPKAELGPKQRVVRSIRKNYRNSKEILLAADALIRAFPVPQDGDFELKVLDPELASRPSAKPIALKAVNPLTAAWQQAKSWLASGNPGYSVCIATANPEALTVADIIAKSPDGVVAVGLSGDYLLNPSHVVVSDMTTIKGFEFSLIIILGLEGGVFPHNKRAAAEVWRDAMRLYVAITRGRDEVRFLYQNQPSVFLDAMGSHIDWREQPPEMIVLPSEPRSDHTESEVPLGKELPAEAGGDKQQSSKPPNQTPQSDPAQPLERRVTFLNGFPCLSIRHGITENQLVELLDCDPVQIALNIQAQDVFRSPTTPLPDHVVKGVLDQRRILVNFVD